MRHIYQQPMHGAEQVDIFHWKLAQRRGPDQAQRQHPDYMFHPETRCSLGSQGGTWRPVPQRPRGKSRAPNPS